MISNVFYPPKKTKFLMILGTASHVGKSILVTALCRIFAKEGYKVAPFKSQNMSLNSWVTKDGKEIGIAQAIQAHAAGIEPTADMNPVLLKPKGNKLSQVIILGKPYADKSAGDYYESINPIFEAVQGALERLSDIYDIIVMEGAGGAAEINLYSRDIANLGVARLTKAPIILVGDIEKGGVFASLYGTLELLPSDIKKQVKGLVINKFRGDLDILKPGLQQIEDLTGIPVLGVLPYTDLKIPSEDSVSIIDKNLTHSHETGNKPISIAIIRLPRISNFTDFEILESYANIRYVNLKDDLGNPDAIIIPGTKNTVRDLKELKKTGMDKKILEFAKKDIPIIGICGGYQILGKEIIDIGIEDKGIEVVKGLCLLDITTVFDKYQKQTKQVEKKVTGTGEIFDNIHGETIKGYEIHMGKTKILQGNTLFEDDGCLNANGLIFGTYLHGLFNNKNIRDAFLGYLYSRVGLEYKSANNNYNDECMIYDNLAKFVKENLDIGKIYNLLKF
ncbi:MAG: cobyric acid synthase [Methanosarcinales archaeon]